MTPVTPSGADLAARCAFPFRADAPQTEQLVTPAMAWGTAISRLGELLTVYGPMTAAAMTAAELSQDVAKLLPCAHHMHALVRQFADVAAEIPLAWDMTSCTTRLERVSHRYYAGVPTGWMPMTLDMCGTLAGEATVIDWKTGRSSRMLSPARALQVRIYGAAYAHHIGASRVRVGFAHVSDAGIDVETDSMGADDIARTAETARAIVASVEHAEPNPGPHCKGKFCRLRDICAAANGGHR